MGYNSKVRQKDKQKQTVREIKLSSLKKISLFITNILIVSLAPKWLSVLGIAFILPTFLYAWFSLKDLLDIYFPVKTKFYKYKHTELFFVTFFTFSLISMLILFEDDVPFSNTPMLISIGIGLLFCLMILIILPYLVKGIFSSSMRRFTIFSTCFFSFPFFY